MCKECGGRLGDEGCEAHFHQMLYWENEDPRNGAVHHLTVLCYYLQHPSRYSPDGLTAAMRLLWDFVAQGKTPEQVRQRDRPRLDSGRRTAKVTSRSGARGAYARPPRWRMTAADVVQAGMPAYCHSVRTWACTTLEDLQTSGNFSPPGTDRPHSSETT